MSIRRCCWGSDRFLSWLKLIKQLWKEVICSLLDWKGETPSDGCRVAEFLWVCVVVERWWVCCIWQAVIVVREPGAPDAAKKWKIQAQSWISRAKRDASAEWFLKADPPVFGAWRPADPGAPLAITGRYVRSLRWARRPPHWSWRKLFPAPLKIETKDNLLSEHRVKHH